MNKEPLVSISCLAFNHAPYIRQCLDGFVMQQTDFNFEVLIHDDASTDGTTEIIKEYEAKYPDIIKPIYETENQWQKGRRGSAVFNFPRAKGKYIALCEGDDYWTDPLKLQKQVDFLEGNPEYSMCCHNAISHWEDGSREDCLFSHIENREYTGPELMNYWFIPTASTIFKLTVVTSALYKDVLDAKLIFGDTPLFLTCAEFGKIRGIEDTMSVYRRQADGFSNNFDSDKYLQLVKSQLKIRELFSNFCGENFIKRIIDVCVDGIAYSWQTKKHVDFKFFGIALRIKPIYFIKRMFKRLK